MSDFKVVAFLKANVKDFANGMQAAKSQIRNLKTESGSSFQSIGKQAQSIGRGLFTALSVPLAGIGAVSVREFGRFEEALIGAGKTNNIQGKELEKLGERFQKLSRDIPLSAVELLKIGEAAGQLGIDKKHIESFTSTMSDLGVATNMTSEDAATNFAQLANITRMPQTEFERLGSTVVELGNNMATTESKISDMALNLAGAGSQVGLSEAQILGLAASISSVGLEAEAGGSAFSRVMQKINSDVLSGSENVKRFAKVSGLSAEEFSKTWKSNPQEAIVSFVKGLKRVKDNGGDVTSTLKELGINSIREIDTLGRLAGAGDLVSKSFDLANKSWEEGNALSIEAEQAYGSFFNQIQFLKNALSELGVEIGKALAPIIKKIVGKVRNLVIAFADLDESKQRIIIAIGAVITAIGPMLLIFGKLIGFLPKLKSGFNLLKGAFMEGGAVAGMFSKAIAFLTSPLGIALVAILALTAGLIYLWHTNEEFRNKVIEIWNTIKTAIQKAWQSLIDYLQPAITAVTDFVKSVWGSLVSWWQENHTMILQAAKNVWNVIKSVVGVAMNAIMDIIKYTWPIIEEVVKVAWNGIKNIVEGTIKVITGIINLFSALLTGDWKALWEAIKRIVSGAFQVVKGIIQVVLETIAVFIKTFISKIKNSFSTGLEYIKTKFSSILSAIKSFVSNQLNSMKSNISSVLNAIKTIFSNILNSLKFIVSRAFNNVRSSVRVGMTQALNVISSFGGRFLQAGRNIVGNIANGIRGAVGKVTGAISGVVQKVRDMLPFSPPKDKSSPLRDIHKNGIGTQIASGIEQGQREVNRAMHNLLDTPASLAMDIGTNQHVSHTLNGSTNRMINIHTKLNVGGYEFKEFTQRVSEQQEKENRLSRYY